MGPITAISIYFVIWWVVFLAVLPLGVQSHHEAGIDLKDGGDPGAPVDPKLWRKFFTTSWISLVVLGAFYLVVRFHLIQLPDVAKVY